MVVLEFLNQSNNEYIGSTRILFDQDCIDYSNFSKHGYVYNAFEDGFDNKFGTNDKKFTIILDYKNSVNNRIPIIEDFSKLNKLIGRAEYIADTGGCWTSEFYREILGDLTNKYIGKNSAKEIYNGNYEENSEEYYDTETTLLDILKRKLY